MGIMRTLQNALRKYMLYRIENGSYKFFIQKLEAEPDIDLASDLYSTDFFRHNLKPLPVQTDELRKVIVFAPHQDDEALGCGGLLCKLHATGSELHIVFLTDGENRTGEMQSVRHEEAKRAAAMLGATMHEIGVSNAELVIEQTHVEQICTLLERIGPDAVFLTWALDAPPVHRLCNALVAKALRESGIDAGRMPTFSYQVHSALLPNVYFDYTDLYEKKQALIGCYASQLKEQNYAHLSAGLDAWNSRFLAWSDRKRFVELYTRLPAEAYIDMIELYYPKNVVQTFKGNERCMTAYKQLKGLNACSS